MTLISDEKEVYVSLKDGSIVYFPFDDMRNESIKVLDKGSPDDYMSVLKLSRLKSFLIGYVDIDEREAFTVYDTVNQKRIWSGVLDLSPGSIREDPDKLLIMSADCLNVYARSANNKGVTMYSLFDGSIITNNTEMHTNYIFQFLVTKDGKTVISTGKDKRIKVWDWIKQKLRSTLSMHDDIIESIVLSDDE